MAEVLHLTGPVLVGPEDVRDEAWVVGGRLTFERPTAAGVEVTRLSGWVVPGLVDAHCHVGLGPKGAVDEATAETQATTDRDSGALLLRDAGSPADTRWIDDREDLPEIIRALHCVLQELQERADSTAAVNAGRNWSTEEEAQLLQEYGMGLPIETIARRHGRSVGAIETRLSELGQREQIQFSMR